MANFTTSITTAKNYGLFEDIFKSRPLDWESNCSYNVASIFLRHLVHGHCLTSDFKLG